MARCSVMMGVILAWFGFRLLFSRGHHRYMRASKRRGPFIAWTGIHNGGREGLSFGQVLDHGFSL
jgi:hypothetical protein